ncbi:MAG: DUF2067 family protein [Candidatus Kariarchaeaceae archaeon]|jgi:hypothetical protein
MPKKHKRRTSQRLQNKRLTFNTGQTFDKEVFLNLAMNIIGNVDVVIESRLERLSIQISGSQEQVDSISDRLIVLEKQLTNATIATVHGFYSYESELLFKLFPIQLQLGYLARVLENHGYETEIETNNTLVTNAKLEVLREIHELAVTSIQEAPPEQNKDIRRFLSVFAMKLQSSHEVIMDLASQEGILRKKQGMYQFAMDSKDAYQKMHSIFEQAPIVDLPQEIDEPEIDLAGLGFDGGKIVLMKNGERLNRDTYDRYLKQDDGENTKNKPKS